MGVTIKKVVVQQGEVKGLITSNNNFVESNCVVISYPAYLAMNQLFDPEVFEKEFVRQVNRLNKTTSVIEVHFALTKRIEEQLQVVFPVGTQFSAKGIFFVSNISSKVSPDGQQLILTGTPVSSEDAINPDRIKKISQEMKENLSTIYSQFNASKDTLWERPMAWQPIAHYFAIKRFCHTCFPSEVILYSDFRINQGLVPYTKLHSSYDNCCNPVYSYY